MSKWGAVTSYNDVFQPTVPGDGLDSEMYLLLRRLSCCSVDKRKLAIETELLPGFGEVPAHLCPRLCRDVLNLARPANEVLNIFELTIFSAAGVFDLKFLLTPEQKSIISHCHRKRPRMVVSNSRAANLQLTCS